MTRQGTTSANAGTRRPARFRRKEQRSTTGSQSRATHNGAVRDPRNCGGGVAASAVEQPPRVAATEAGSGDAKPSSSYRDRRGAQPTRSVPLPQIRDRFEPVNPRKDNVQMGERLISIFCSRSISTITPLTSSINNHIRLTFGQDDDLTANNPQSAG